VLRSRLQSADERARFLREGQLAASISHPHTVYIFGSEEISGTPVISMELTPGGTLKDRVKSGGPLAPEDAVSTVLDIIGGLDAAQSSGILHRDIKPSNCFVDSQGAVKIGDFGLSISTLARDVRDGFTGGFQGTPQFAAPEQLRGEPLDVRADIYAVGATLYYLLTGQPPFDSRELRELVEKVTSEAPKSTRLLRRQIPSGLDSIVLKCLAKSPSDRPASYAALAAALRSFSNVGNRPAGLGLRFLAGIVDSAILTAVSLLLLLPITGSFFSVAKSYLWTGIPLLLYFLMEGSWGATPGKLLLGLRVRSVEGGVASWPRIACRHLLFDAPTLVWIIFIPVVGVARFDAFIAASPTFTTVASLASFAALGALFLTARRRNGWAAIHDLISRTRLVMRGPVQLRGVPTPGLESIAGKHVDSGRSYGPFTVISDAGAADGGRVLLGFDPTLRRRVWIRTLPPDAPVISATRRDVSRVGRLHWLTGKRSAEENWDAFEAPDGEPLRSCRGGISWATMKLWLLDLSSELQAALQDQTLPKLALDRIWLRPDGRLVLLDFPAIGPSSPQEVEEAGLSPVRLLSAVARHTPSTNLHDPDPLPLGVRRMLDRWASPSPPEFSEARAALLDLSFAMDHVPKWRRAAPIMVTALWVLFIAGTSLLGFSEFRRVLNPEKQEMISLLQSLNGNPGEPRLADPAYRAAVEQYLAGRHRASLRDSAFWENEIWVKGTPQEALRAKAEEIAGRHPYVSDDDVSRAANLIAPQIEKLKQVREDPRVGPSAIIAIAGAAYAFITIAWIVISSAILPGGLLLRAVGLAVVNRHGREISRWRSMVRALTAWTPVIFWILWVVVSVGTDTVYTPFQTLLIMGMTFFLFALGVLWTIAHPEQGFHDRVLRTRVVPR
jgi:uncharacterized RDD family membrane protein YckC